MAAEQINKEANATKNSAIGDVIRNTNSKVRADGRSDNVQRPADSKVSDKEVQDLFNIAMKGYWDKVLEACKKNHEILKIRITNSEERALHITVADGRNDIVLKLGDSMGEGDDAKEILNIQNATGNTALHLAAALGNAPMCHCMASKDPNLVDIGNKENETPLFLAARHGMEAAFLCLQSYDKQLKKEESSAQTPRNACDEENLKSSTSQAQTLRNAGDEEDHKSSTAQGVEAFKLQLPNSRHPLIVTVSEGPSKKEDKEDKLFQNIFATSVVIFRGMALLIIVLGVGISRIKDIIDMKERHTWAKQVMNKLVDSTVSYKYEDDSGGRDPKKFWLSTDESPFLPSADSDDDEEKEKIVGKFVSSYQAIIKDLNTPEKKKVLLTFERKDTEIKGETDTAIFIAAKLGVTEMVKKILDKFPVSSRDLDSGKKNIALLAVENRQVSIFKLLLHHKNLRKSVFQQLDSQGNSALHLAAKYVENPPWSVPVSALQMQWEIKWNKFVENNLPPNLFIGCNYEGKTPKEMFAESHKNLVQEGREWLTKTSESCSVVAALIATVAYATSTTVPGGVDQGSGKPILEQEIVFNVFSISSLVALSFSITSLVIFLTILASRFKEHDFADHLPRKLLNGLVTLSISIVAVLISFCCGHSFTLTDKMRSIAVPTYAAACLPMAFFALTRLPFYFGLIRAYFTKVPQRSYIFTTH